MHNHLNPEDGRKENNEISTLYLRKNKLPEHPFILDLNDDQSGPKKCTRKKPQRWKYNISFLRTECLWKQQILIFPYQLDFFFIKRRILQELKEKHQKREIVNTKNRSGLSMRETKAASYTLSCTKWYNSGINENHSKREK